MPTKRSLEALRLNQSNPSWTLVHIGQEMGLTRERGRQLLASEGIHIRHKKGHHSPRYTCPKCGGQKSEGGKLCRRCSYKQRFPVYPRLHSECICRWCGRQFPHKVRKTSPGTFCSKRCQGLRLGKYVKHFKYDYEMVYQKS